MINKNKPKRNPFEPSNQSEFLKKLYNLVRLQLPILKRKVWYRGQLSLNPVGFRVFKFSSFQVFFYFYFFPLEKPFPRDVAINFRLVFARNKMWKMLYLHKKNCRVIIANLF